MSRICVPAVCISLLAPLTSPFSYGRDLIVKLRNGEDVVFVGAMQRWDVDGNPIKPIDAKAKVNHPAVTAEAKRHGKQTWIFSKLPAGRYDLVLLKKDRIRIEGFHYPPILEFDPILPAKGREPEEEARQWIVREIAKGRYYENKVSALHLAGDARQIRVFVQLVRDEPTSYDGEVGYPVATVRHEVWQYTFRYGTWTKEKATRVFDRILLPRKEWSQWTWIWDPQLGGIEIGADPRPMEVDLPARHDAKSGKGWFPF